MTIHYDEIEDQYWIATNDGVQYFISPLQAKDALREAEIKQRVDEEVASIAAWFRHIGMTQAAMAIEARNYKND